MSEQTTYLYAIPTWTEGVGRLVDFGGFLSQYNTSSTDDEADARALALDWLAVGSDLRRAMRIFAENEGLIVLDG